MATDVVSVLAGALARVGEDGELRRLTPGLDCGFRLRVGDKSCAFRLADGTVEVLPADAACELEMRLPAETGARMLENPPAPRHQGFTALQIGNPAAEFSGDPVRLAQARAGLERVFEIALAAPTRAAPARPRDLSRVSGRYMRVAHAGESFDMFTDMAGPEDATPLVFLHTAGADSRQFQMQLADLGLMETYRLHAPDMPFHGRSLPPLDWSGEPYALSAERYAGWVAAYLEQVVGRPAILAGCSMGAAITLTLAARRPDLLTGAIAIEPPFQATGRINRGQNDVAVHAGLHNAAFVRGLMAPTSPESYRRRAAWIYSQAAPGVYQADLGFYSREFDGAAVAPLIDARATPLALMSGAYDYSASPEHSERLAELTPGAHRVVMPELGHFPMTEHPDLFATYLDHALGLISGRGASPAREDAGAHQTEQES